MVVMMPLAFDLADAVIEVVGNEQLSGSVDRDTGRAIQLRAGCRATVSTETIGSIACNRGDDPGGIDLADSGVPALRYVEISRRVESGTLDLSHFALRSPGRRLR